MSDTDQRPLQLSLGMGAGQQNRYLFSDHFLEQLLVADGRWEAKAILPKTNVS